MKPKKMKLIELTARNYADKIYKTSGLKDISDFNISLQSAVNMMNDYANLKMKRIKRKLLIAKIVFVIFIVLCSIQAKIFFSLFY